MVRPSLYFSEKELKMMKSVQILLAASFLGMGTFQNIRKVKPQLLSNAAYRGK
jgi:hypothetical protein